MSSARAGSSSRRTCPRGRSAAVARRSARCTSTSANVTPGILRHESVHRAQWKKYGLSYIPLYVAAGQDAVRNRFEIEAGLKDGGYR